MPTFTQHGHREPQEALDEVIELGVGVGIGRVNRPSESLCGPQKGVHFLEGCHLIRTFSDGHLFTWPPFSVVTLGFWVGMWAWFCPQPRPFTLLGWW